MSWSRETVKIKGHASVAAYRQREFAVHPRISATSGTPATDGQPERHGIALYGYVLTHLPTGLIVASCDDPEELIRTGELLLDSGDWKSRRWQAVTRKMRPLYHELRGAGSWPQQDIDRRSDANVAGVSS